MRAIVLLIVVRLKCCFLIQNNLINLELFHLFSDIHCFIPANTRHSPNAVSMLAHRLRRWPNIETALGEFIVFAGM